MLTSLLIWFLDNFGILINALLLTESWFIDTDLLGVDRVFVVYWYQISLKLDTEYKIKYLCFRRGRVQKVTTQVR